MKHDRTFEATSAYASAAWCAATLGQSLAWFRRERSGLEAIGFPKVDPICGLTMKADVQEWISRRRKYADRAIVEPSETGRIHHDRL